MLPSPHHRVSFVIHPHRYENLQEAGVLDPAKVLTNALENSVSVASLVLTTEALVTTVPKKALSAAEQADQFDNMGGLGGPQDYM